MVQGACRESVARISYESRVSTTTLRFRYGSLSLALGQDGKLVFALYLLANSHLPPLEEQAFVKQDFIHDALHRLYTQLTEEDNIYAPLIIDGIDRLEEQRVKTLEEM